MVFRTLVQTWLQNAAKAHLRDAVARVAQSQLAPTAAEPIDEEPKPCDLGIVFTSGLESGCLEDLLQGAVTIRGGNFVMRVGGWKGRRVIVICSGRGHNHAAQATEILIDGHKPRAVISAGFASALCPALKRNDILIADRLLTSEGGQISLELPPVLSAALALPGVHRGPLLSTDHAVRLPREKHSLFQRHAALAVDGETFAVAEVCLRRQTPLRSLRVINDTVDESLPRDVEHLLVQKTTTAQLGAALGAIWRRPASAKDLYRLQENALIASGRLAKFVVEHSFD
jgi:adenosylhomocysteine nucleosidase